MAADEGTPEQRPDPATAAARSMTQLAQQMREMAERMLGGGMAAWPAAGAGLVGCTCGRNRDRGTGCERSVLVGLS